MTTMTMVPASQSATTLLSLALDAAQEVYEDMMDPEFVGTLQGEKAYQRWIGAATVLAAISGNEGAHYASYLNSLYQAKKLDD